MQTWGSKSTCPPVRRDSEGHVCRGPRGTGWLTKHSKQSSVLGVPGKHKPTDRRHLSHWAEGQEWGCPVERLQGRGPGLCIQGDTSYETSCAMAVPRTHDSMCCQLYFLWNLLSLLWLKGRRCDVFWQLWCLLPGAQGSQSPTQASRGAAHSSLSPRDSPVSPHQQTSVFTRTVVFSHLKVSATMCVPRCGMWSSPGFSKVGGKLSPYLNFNQHM